MDEHPRCHGSAASRRALSVLVVVIALVALAPDATATRNLGELETSDVPHVTGTLDATGAGEVQVRGTENLRLEATAGKLVVERISSVKSYVLMPNGAAIEVDNKPTETETFEFARSGLVLDGVDATDGFRTFLAGAPLKLRGTPDAPDQATFAVADRNVDDLALTAHKDPRLVTDAVGGDAEDQPNLFTYRVDGVRFPLETDYVEATGTLGLLVEGGAFTVSASGTTEVFHAGEWTEETGPNSYDAGTSWYLVKLENAEAWMAGNLVSWFAQPEVLLDGTLATQSATGHLKIEGQTVRDTDRPLKIDGQLRFLPQPAGTFVADSDVPNTVGTTEDADADNRPGTYQGISTPVSGMVRSLEFGAAVVSPNDKIDIVTATATVGFLGLLGAAFAATPNGKWLLAPALAPLYAKTEKDRLLDNASRERIFQAIRANPGINLSEVNRLAELGWGVTVYHLKMLEKNGLIFSYARTRDRCFFENTPRNRSLTDAISALANKERVQAIAQAVVRTPGRNQSQLIESTGLTQRTASYYLSRLAKDGLVERRREKNYTFYYPTNDLVEALPIVTGHEGDAAPVAGAPGMATQPGATPDPLLA